jgi:ABC-2 type transport system permease protein
MRPILVLVRKDLTNFLRNKAAVSLTFAIPFAMIYLFGQIFGINQKDSGPSGIPIAVVNASTNSAAAKLVDALKSEKSLRIITETGPKEKRRPLTEADLRPMMQAAGADFRFAIVIPEDVISDTRLGLHLKFLSNPRNEIETQTVNGLLQKTIFSNVPELLGASLQARARSFLGDASLNTFNRGLASAIAGAFGGNLDDILARIENGNFGFDQLTQAATSGGSNAGTTGSEQKSAMADVFSRIVQIDNEQVVGAKVKSPMATALVGGWAIQFLLFALSASATSLFRERDAGIFQRLLAAPVTRAQILWSKFVYGVLLGLTQLLVLFFAAGLLFGIEILPHLPLLALTCVFAAAACTSFGMLLAAISSSQEAASGLATFLIMLMSAIGGAWFPISFMPQFIQQFSKLTLVYWSMEGFSAVLWAGQGLVQLLPILGILGGITVVVMSIAVWRFNRGKIFG